MSYIPFPEILASYRVDIKKEIRKLHELFYESPIETNSLEYEKRLRSMYQLCSDFFFSYKHRGLILSLSEFDEAFGFNRFSYMKYYDGEELDALISFCEYVYNLINNISFPESRINDCVKFLAEHIQILCSSLGYVIHNDNGMYHIVPSNGVIDYVCEKMGNDVTQLIRVYSHKTTKGNLAIKQQILSTLCKELEPYKKGFSKLNMSDIADNVFCGANNCDIRHNNSDQEGKNYCANFAGLTEEERESIYDNMFENIIVLLSAMIGSEAIDELNGEIAGIKRKLH